jgi:hypothetical protein
MLPISRKLWPIFSRAAVACTSDVGLEDPAKLLVNGQANFKSRKSYSVTATPLGSQLPDSFPVYDC